MDEWVRQRDTEACSSTVGAQAAVTALVLFLSAHEHLLAGVRQRLAADARNRLRTALGANAAPVLAGILSRGMVLMGSGITAGGALLLLFVAKNWPAEDVALYAGYLGVTSAVMLAACLLACIGPARRALRINPADALREA